MKLNNTPPIMINNRCHAGLARNSHGCIGCFICSVSIGSHSLHESLLLFVGNVRHLDGMQLLAEQEQVFSDKIGVFRLCLLYTSFSIA